MRQLLCLVLVGCASVSQPDEGCITDRDCKGARICDARLQMCVDPTSPPGDGGADGALDPPSCISPPTGRRYPYATSALKLPSSAMGYALDIDGDGRPDNQLKALVGAIAGAGLDLQGPIDRSVQNGEAVILLGLQAADLQSGCANANLALAQRPMMPPKYDGSDTFVVNGAQQPAVLYGSIRDYKLGTLLPKIQRGSQVQTIQLSLRFSMGTVPLTIHGVHVQGVLSPTGVMSGEIHGVIRKTDIDSQIIPAMAQLLTDQIHKAPMSATTETLIRLFEDPAGNEASRKKCMETPPKCCAPPANRATCEILAEEVRQNALIGNVLAPDVQVYQNATWQPLPQGMMKDAMSVGLGFSAVKAQF